MEKPEEQNWITLLKTNNQAEVSSVISLLKSEDIPVRTDNEVSSRMNIGGQTEILILSGDLNRARTLIGSANIEPMNPKPEPDSNLPKQNPKELEANFEDGGIPAKVLLWLIGIGFVILVLWL